MVVNYVNYVFTLFYYKVIVRGRRMDGARPASPPPPTYTFTARVVVRDEDGVQYQSGMPGAAVARWYRQRLRTPYSDDRFQPCGIRVSACGDVASDGIRIAFRLQRQTPAGATPDDAQFFMSMLVDPDDDGNYPIRVPGTTVRALVIGARQ